jgi:cyclase
MRLRFAFTILLLASLAVAPPPALAAEIHDAAGSGDLDTVRGLLAAAPDLVDATDDAGATPLILAAQGGHLEVCRLLLERGAVPGHADFAGDEAIHFAALGGSQELVELLLEHGAALDPADDLGYRPLIFAVYGGHGDMARLLLARGARPDPVSVMGLSPLGMAARNGDVGLVRELVAAGADVDRRDGFGRTPLWEAENAGRGEAAAVLRAAGAVNDYEIGRPLVTTHAANCLTVAVPHVNRSNSTVLATGEGLIVVDTAHTGSVPGLREGYDRLGGGPVRFIVNTHLHADHTAGNALVDSTATVVSFATLDSLTAAGILRRGDGELRGPGGRTLPAPYVLALGEEEVRIIPYPGIHSDSDVLVHLPGPGVLCMGSLLISEGFPGAQYGTLDRYLELLDAVLEIFPAGTRFVPGHGRTVGREELRAYRGMVSDTIRLVREAMARGHDLDRMLADDILAAHAHYGECRFLPYITTRLWLKTIYLSYGGGG